MDKTLQKHLKETFSSAAGKRLKRPFTRTYMVKDKRRKRPLQFLRPQLYCYAYPHYFSSVPSSQPASETITVRVVNAGGAASNNAIVQLTGHVPNEKPYTHTRRLHLQAGEGRNETFSFSAIEKTRFYQLACFDPLHDPVTPAAITQLASVSRSSILNNAIDPKIGSFNQISGWDELHKQSNGNWQPASSPTWWTRSSNPSPGTVARQRNLRYIATSNGTPQGSQLRQTVSINNLNLPAVMTGYLNRGELRASLDGLVYLQGASNSLLGQIEIDCLSSAGAVLHSFTSPNPTQRNAWIRVTGSMAVPSGTAQIVCKLVAFRPNSPTSRRRRVPSRISLNHIYFDQLHLRLTPRNIFTTGRIYSF